MGVSPKTQISGPSHIPKLSCSDGESTEKQLECFRTGGGGEYALRLFNGHPKEIGVK